MSCRLFVRHQTFIQPGSSDPGVATAHAHSGVGVTCRPLGGHDDGFTVLDDKRPNLRLHMTHLGVTGSHRVHCGHPNLSLAHVAPQHVTGRHWPWPWADAREPLDVWDVPVQLTPGFNESDIGFFQDPTRILPGNDEVQIFQFYSKQYKIHVQYVLHIEQKTYCTCTVCTAHVHDLTNQT